jgi:pyruvate dehydrogenase E2 component (dihydrolipoamide acetyltransferase)
MAKPVEMPKMGYDMTEGKISRWIKHEGDPVAVGDAIAEIETDKVNIEIEAFDAGVLRKIVRQVGETVPVGAVIAVIGEADEPIDLAALGIAGAPAAPPAQPAPAAQPAPTNGATAAAPAPAAAVPAAAPAPAAATAAPPAARPLPEGPLNLPPGGGFQRLTRPSIDHLKASPVARRLAEEYGVDLSRLKGSGPNGRIVKDDVEAYLRQAPAAAEPVPAAAPAAPAAPAPVPVPAPVAVPAAAGAEEVPLSRMRQTIARVTSQSKQQVPHIYLTIDVMMDAAMALRQQLNAALEGEGVKISVNDLVVKATAKALVKHRYMNASYAGDKVIIHPTVDIGIAVSLDQGLISPIIRDADKKALSVISQETRELAAKARNGTLRPEEFSGGTFTISNLGMFNIDEFDAIIVQPQAGILAIGAAAPRPVVKDGQLAIATTMRLTLSADHRVTDGAPAAVFLNEIRRLLETPMLLLA